MSRSTLSPLLAALLVGVLAGAAFADGATVKGEGYRLRLPPNFRQAPSSVGSELQARIQGLMSGSGLPLSGTPTGRVFQRFGTATPATLVVMTYRIPEGSGLADGTDLNADQLARAWDVAVGSSGREAVRDVRKEQLNGLHTGVKATLSESVQGGHTADVRIAVTVAHGQIIVMAYDAPDGTQVEHSEAWTGVLRGLRVVAPGRNWGLYMKYGGIVAAGLVLLTICWWLVLRPRNSAVWPGRPGKADTQIRSADGLGMFQEPAAPAAEEPSFLRPKELSNPLDVDPFAKLDDPDVEPLPMPSVGADWDPENDPAFAVPDDEIEAPIRPQLDYNSDLVAEPTWPPKLPTSEASPPAASPPAATPPPKPEQPGQTDPGAISRSLDSLFGE